MRSLCLGLFVALVGCQPSTSTVSPEPTEPTATPDTSADEQADPATTDDDCPSLVEDDVANEAYERGVALLEEARDGEHYRAEPFEQGLGALLTAAEQGHRGAQSLYGRRRFESLFMAQAPTEAERDDYVAALAFIRVAALRGDEDAAGYLPGIADAPDPSMPPYDSFAPEWIEQAVAKADAWIKCHGEAAGDRGTQ